MRCERWPRTRAAITELKIAGTDTVSARAIGDVEPILTFTLPPEELRAIRTGVVDDVNPPSQGYHDVIARGLVELGMNEELADGYLRERYVLV